MGFPKIYGFESKAAIIHHDRPCYDSQFYVIVAGIDFDNSIEVGTEAGVFALYYSSIPYAENMDF